MRTGEGLGAGGGEIDPADLWVLDPATGEYRLRQPGERPPPPSPAGYAAPAAPAAWAATTTAPPLAPAPTPAQAQAPSPAPAPGGGRASRRRQPGVRTGPWIAGALCFLVAVGGASAYALSRGSSADADNATTAVPRSACSASHPAAPAPTSSVEPPVSGSFLNGSKAAPIDIRVTVLDGSGTFGQAEAVLEWMQNTKGYLRSSNGGPAPAVVPRTTLVYAPDHASQARALAQAMGLPASALHGDGDTGGTIGRMVLTLGQDFHGIGKPFAVLVPAAPSASAPAPAGGGAGAANGCGSQ
ncbi:LytR C-terminal domain-containing protein [Streptacidiphilus sp. PB12-B1b]|uniref:LytR C-terminal domain-containing protein n=1 Tax=Streptacidiphilus sp. PB12-B1b TaxID=2705012 RepID=UPI0015F7B896|nr:LytR C-terminal domain-containing protein [Streptacidiphilus sp. PB12-B1b]QMU75300.1 LytR C-terminal domain-containing protein [Streptacidiphilus sp. PB12-B1b]